MRQIGLLAARIDDHVKLSLSHFGYNAVVLDRAVGSHYQTQRSLSWLERLGVDDGRAFE